MIRSALLFFLAIIVPLCAGIAAAEMVVVTPSSPGDWTWTAANMAALYFANFGPAVDEGAGFPYGSGAFYGMCGESGNSQGETPGTVWLGSDKQNGTSLVGVPINRIKTLKYSTYVSTWSTYRDPETRLPQWPRQPFQLQIAIAKTDGKRVYLFYRPWGLTGKDAGNTGQFTGIWQTWNALTCNQTSPNDVWYGYEETGGSGLAEAQYANWAAVCSAFPGATLAPTSTGFNPDHATRTIYEHKSVGWDLKTSPKGWPTCCGTGKCINLEVGARKWATDVFGQDKNYAWWKESFSFRGYVDNLILGVDFNGDGDDADASEKITYDFDSDGPPPRKVGILCSNCYDFAPGIMGSSFVDRNFRFKVCGIVAYPYGLPAIGDDEFYLWDGSYAWIYDKEAQKNFWGQAFVVVHAPGHNAQPGQVWSALGDVRRSLWLSQPYNYIWTNLGDCLKIAD